MRREGEMGMLVCEGCWLLVVVVIVIVVRLLFSGVKCLVRSKLSVPVESNQVQGHVGAIIGLRWNKLGKKAE